MRGVNALRSREKSATVSEERVYTGLDCTITAKITGPDCDLIPIYNA